MVATSAQQINGREGETATFLKTSSVILCLCVFGFAPRHLNRSVLSYFHTVAISSRGKPKDEK